jgi:chemotaxis protein methyltransferase CheR
MNKKHVFTPVVYEQFSHYLGSKLGMECKLSKKGMLESKLDNFMRIHNIERYEELLEYLKKNEGTEVWNQFVHRITTHKTDFFRENQHFEFLKKNFETIMSKNKRIRLNREVRIWSAGCSTGEEPYTMAMFFLENFPEIYPKILATDISTESLKTALKGFYPFSIKNEMQPYFITKYFERTQKGFQINPTIKNYISFRSFNLTKDFSFKKGFDIIFCRNVMIYFSESVREKLVNKFYNSLVPSGIFIIGHSESLINLKQNFKYLKPTIYIK